MSARVLILAVAVLAAGVLAVILMTSRASGPKSEGGSESAVRSGESGTVTSGRSRPSLPAEAGRTSRIPTGPDRSRPELKGVEPVSDPGFAAEERDQAWALTKERAIRDRVEGLLEQVRGSDEKAVTVARVECKSTRCRLRVAGGDSQRFMKFVEALQGSDGFHGRASQLMLQGYAPAAEPGGRTSVSVMLVFTREDR